VGINPSAEPVPYLVRCAEHPWQDSPTDRLMRRLDEVVDAIEDPTRYLPDLTGEARGLAFGLTCVAPVTMDDVREASVLRKERRLGARPKVKKKARS
jgi:hypothetical protein